MFHTHSFALAVHSNNTRVHYTPPSESTFIVTSTRMQCLLNVQCMLDVFANVPKPRRVNNFRYKAWLERKCAMEIMQWKYPAMEPCNGSQLSASRA